MTAAPSRAGSSPRSRAMDGRAVVTAEPSRFCMNSAQATMAAVRRGSASREGAAAAALAAAIVVSAPPGGGAPAAPSRWAASATPAASAAPAEAVPSGPSPVCGGAEPPPASGVRVVAGRVRCSRCAARSGRLCRASPPPRRGRRTAGPGHGHGRSTTRPAARRPRTSAIASRKPSSGKPACTSGRSAPAAHHSTSCAHSARARGA